MTRRFFPSLTRRESILYSLEGAGIAVLADYLCYRSLPALLSVPLVIFLFLRFQEEQKKHRTALARQEEFKNLMAMLYSSTAAGATLQKAFREARQEMGEGKKRFPVLGPELDRLLLELDRNLPIDQALDHFGKRSGDHDIQNFVQVLRAAAKSGGSLPEIIRKTAQMASVRLEMNAQIETMLAGRRAEFRIMLLVPAGILLYMNLASGDYMAVLYQTLTGRVLMTAALFLYLAAFAIGRRILAIRV